MLQNWLRNRNTVEFLGVWEQINNPDFKPLEFEEFRSRAGLNSFVLAARQWIEAIAAVGLVAKQVRNGSTFAHKDIAFQFASRIARLNLVRRRDLKARCGSCDATKTSYRPDRRQEGVVSE